MARTFFLSGTIAAFLSVALGAFAAHGLKELLSPQYLLTFKTAVEYQFFHSLALILVALAMILKPDMRHLAKAGWSILLGIILFSGSLYILAVTNIKMFGMITPIGGIAFLIGWGYFTMAAWNLNKNQIKGDHEE